MNIQNRILKWIVQQGIFIENDISLLSKSNRVTLVEDDDEQQVTLNEYGLNIFHSGFILVILLNRLYHLLFDEKTLTELELIGNRFLSVVKQKRDEWKKAKRKSNYWIFSTKINPATIQQNWRVISSILKTIDYDCTDQTIQSIVSKDDQVLSQFSNNLFSFMIYSVQPRVSVSMESMDQAPPPIQKQTRKQTPSMNEKPIEDEEETSKYLQRFLNKNRPKSDPKQRKKRVISIASNSRRSSISSNSPVESVSPQPVVHEEPINHINSPSDEVSAKETPPFEKEVAEEHYEPSIDPPAYVNKSKKEDVTLVKVEYVEYDEDEYDCDVSEARTCMDFLVLAIRSSLHIRNDRAIALLTTDIDQLTKLIINGDKTFRFEQIRHLYKLVYCHVELITLLIEIEPISAPFCLSIISLGLQSEDDLIVESTLVLLTRISKSLKDRQDFSNNLWDWFVQEGLPLLLATAHRHQNRNISLKKQAHELIYELSKDKLGSLLGQYMPQPKVAELTLPNIQKHNEELNQHNDECYKSSANSSKAASEIDDKRSEQSGLSLPSIHNRQRAKSETPSASSRRNEETSSVASDPLPSIGKRDDETSVKSVGSERREDETKRRLIERRKKEIERIRLERERKKQEELLQKEQEQEREDRIRNKLKKQYKSRKPTRNDVPRVDRRESKMVVAEIMDDILMAVSQKFQEPKEKKRNKVPRKREEKKGFFSQFSPEQRGSAIFCLQLLDVIIEDVVSGEAKLRLALAAMKAEKRRKKILAWKKKAEANKSPEDVKPSEKSQLQDGQSAIENHKQRIEQEREEQEKKRREWEKKQQAMLKQRQKEINSKLEDYYKKKNEAIEQKKKEEEAERKRIEEEEKKRQEALKKKREDEKKRVAEFKQKQEEEARRREKEKLEQLEREKLERQQRVNEYVVKKNKQQKELKLKNDAASKIQQVFRKYILRKRAAQEFEKVKSSTKSSLSQPDRPLRKLKSRSKRRKKTRISMHNTEENTSTPEDEGSQQETLQKLREAQRREEEEAEKKGRNDAATKIQKVFRGSFERKKVAELRNSKENEMVAAEEPNWETAEIVDPDGNVEEWVVK